MDISAENRELFRRAIADPASVTPAEKNDILWLPPPDVENQLHQSTFNVSSRAALVAKALPDDGAQLTLPEAKWLARIGRIDPFVEDGPIGVVERAERRFRTPIADRDLLDQAQAAVLTADEKTAKLHGEHQADRLREERKRVKEQNRDRAKKLLTPLPIGSGQLSRFTRTPQLQ